MSAALLAAVERTTLRPTTKAVLFAMVGLVGKDRVPKCWASVATIAKRAGLSERTIQGRLRWLENSGFITLDREAVRYSARRYRINLGAIVGAARVRENARENARKNARHFSGISPAFPEAVRGDNAAPLEAVRGADAAPKETTTNKHGSFRSEQASTTSTIARENAPELRSPAAPPGKPPERESEPVEAGS